MAEVRIDGTALEILAATPGVLRALLAAAPAEAVEAPADEGWSAKDVVAHLLDAEGIAFTERIRCILREDRPFIRSIDPTIRLREQGYPQRSLSSLLDEFEQQRAEDIAWLRTLPAEQLARSGEHDRAGEISIADIVHYWAYHDLMHLQQIARMLQSQLLGKLGNTRRFFEEG